MRLIFYYYDGSLDNLIRVDFSNGHKNHGQIRYYDDGAFDKLTRKEYAKGHPMHGEVRHLKEGKLTKIDFPDGRSFVPEQKKRKVIEVILLEE